MKKILLILIIFSSSFLTVKAQSCHFLCNGDFENPQYGSWIDVADTVFPCWKTTEPDSIIEVWWTGFESVPAYSGNQFVELNANAVGTLFQNFVIAPNTHISIGFAHRGRAGVDTMSVSIGPVGGPYTTIGTYGDGNTAWGYYTVYYTIPSSLGSYYSLRFNSIYASGGPTIGNFLDDIQVDAYPGITTTASSKNTTCNSDSDGSASVKATSGVAPYTYQWSAGQTTSSVTGLSGGMYTCMITDANGCSAVDTVTITQEGNLGCIIPTSVTLICSGDKTGSATAAPVGGTAPFTYKWTPGGQTTASVSGLGAGMYTVTVTDSGGCVATDTITISQSPHLNCSIPKKTNLTCNSGNSGSATANASGGVAPYTYSWAPGGQTTAAISNLSAGTYTVTASDVNGCTGSAIVTIITQPPVLFACCNKTILIGGSDTITADSAVHYQWSPGATLNCDTCKTVIASPTVTTTYTVTGTDANGCITERVITVIVETPCNNFIVPNVFTPNGDAINEQLVIKAEHMDSYSIYIYDRWGKEMFKSTDATVYWNGLTEGGSKAPDGVYYYLINSTCQGNSYKKDGYVQLIR